ncbi:hypothetical protein B0H14DRAFT_463704 [Mycena olivaceomarginata]|nr:hypothetical protein B0H14DRAFT_463704 [Mycena olivaceomarginata]
MERAGVKQFALAPMDTTRDWFFLMKKVRLFSIPLMDDDMQIGPALDGGMPSPLWSYQFGLQTGFMPTDPRHSVGICAALGVVKDPSTMSSARGRRTARARGRSPQRPSSRMVSGRPRGPGDAAADAHRGSEHCVLDVYDARRGLHVSRYMEDDWLAGRCARRRCRGDLSFDWTIHTWDLSRTFISCTFHHGLDGPSFYIYPFVAFYFLPN